MPNNENAAGLLYVAFRKVLNSICLSLGEFNFIGLLQTHTLTHTKVTAVVYVWNSGIQLVFEGFLLGGVCLDNSLMPLPTAWC